MSDFIFKLKTDYIRDKSTIQMGTVIKETDKTYQVDFKDDGLSRVHKGNVDPKTITVRGFHRHYFTNPAKLKQAYINAYNVEIKHYQERKRLVEKAELEGIVIPV